MNKILTRRTLLVSAFIMLALFSNIEKVEAKSYTVKFVDGLTNKRIKKETVKKGESAAAPLPPNHKGYTFQKWNRSFKKVTKNMTVAAKYKKKKYKVTFVDGLTNKTIAIKKVSYKEKAVAPKPKKHKGYRFVKWDRKFNKVTGNITVKAKYIKTYTVIFKSGKKVLKKEIVDKGKSAHPPVAPSRTEMKFAGWNKSYKNVQKNLIIKAKYKEWPNLKNKAENFKYWYGGLKNGEEILGTKKCSMRQVESYEYRDHLPARSKELYNKFLHYLKSGNDTGITLLDLWSRDYNDSVMVYWETASAAVRELYGTYISEEQANKHAEDNFIDFNMQNYQIDLAKKKEIQNYARTLVSTSTTERDASAKFLEAITNRLTYSDKPYLQNSRAWNAWAKRKGHCQAYSKLYKIMCNTVGIECELIVGHVDLNANGKRDENEGHMWNRVKIDNVWYYMDLAGFDVACSDIYNHDDFYRVRECTYAKKLWSGYYINYLF